MKKIAWIGTGVMGKPMALHLAKAGHDVTVYNRTDEKAKAMEPDVKAVKTIKEAVENADVIFTIVGFPKDVKEVYSEIFKFAKSGAICLDMTTSSPTLAKELYLEGKEKNIKVLDAPVTGGDLGAINATLSIMVGGDKDVFDAIFPYLKLMGKTINYMGSEGLGQHSKLANQTAIAGAIAGTAEALIYAQDKGIPLETMLNVITGGSASSWQAINNGAKMISKDNKPGFFIKHFLKDLNLVMDEKHELHLPIVESVTKIYQTLLDHDYGEMGTQAIIEYYLKKL